MRADVNQSNESEGVRKLFVGAFNMHVTAINPNLAEMNKMGIKTDKEPDYFLYDKEEKEKKTGIMIKIYLENQFKEDTIKSSVTFFLRKSIMESKKDGQESKFNYIDERGNSIFIEESLVTSKQVPYTWLHADSLKKAVIGEPELVNFIRAITNAERYGATMFEVEDLRRIFTGDIVSVKSVIKKAKDLGNTVRVVLLPKISGSKILQYTYEKQFERSWSSTSKYLHKSLIDNRSRLSNGVIVPFSENFNEAEFFIREVDPSEMITKFGSHSPTENPSYASGTHSAMAGGPAAAITADDLLPADDLPF